MSKRLDEKFSSLKKQGKSALITYMMAFDPSYDESLAILKGLPGAGADIIELGMAFSDPMADGPTIQKAAIRALDAGSKLKKILEMVIEFRKNNNDTPVVLMGYYNPIQYYGVEQFMLDSAKAGVDGLLIVDLPIEEDDELYQISGENDIASIKLVTPTTGDERLQKIIKKSAGFIYYVAVAGVTGTKSASYDSVADAVLRIKKYTDIPVAVGFGIKTANDVSQVAKSADGVVVGSSIVNKIAQNNRQEVLSFVENLSKGL